MDSDSREANLSDYDEITTCDDLEWLLDSQYDDNLSSVLFECHYLSERYNNKKHEHILNSVLDEKSNIFYPNNLKCIKIRHSLNPELLCTILLHFVVRKHNIITHSSSSSTQSFIVEHCDVSTFFNNENFIRITKRNNIDICNIKLHASNILNNNNNNINDRDAIRTGIEECSIFTSWHMSFCHNVDLIFILNALAQNRYIQALQITCKPFARGETEIFINSITNIVTATKTLSKLDLDFQHDSLVCSTSAMDSLVEALINSETVIDLSIHGIGRFSDEEILRRIHSVLMRKANIQLLKLDLSTFYYKGKLDFVSSTFTNIFNNNNNNKDHHLCELNFDFELMSYKEAKEASQEIRSFFALIKNSFIEKLTIRVWWNYGGMSKGLEEMFSPSVGRCSRTLVRVKAQACNGEYEEETEFEKYLKRNCGIAACIENKTKFPKSIWPKIMSVAKPTGPDAAFCLLNYLGDSVGPNNDPIKGRL